MRQSFHLAVLMAAFSLIAAQRADDSKTSGPPTAPTERGLYGNWRVASLTLVGEEGEKEKYPNAELNVPLSAITSEKDLILWAGTQQFAVLTYRLDATQTPPAIDAVFQGRDLQGIYRREGDVLRIALNETGTGRPRDFQSPKTSLTMELRREPGGPMFVLNADGSGLRQVTDLLAYTRSGSPQWSPDGKRIAFDAARVILEEPWSQSHIFLVDPVNKKTDDLGRGAMPSWSPDGKRIAYSKYSPRGVWMKNADGSGDRQIAAGGWGVRWSPKNEEVAYLVSDSGGGNLCVQDLKTGKIRNLLEPGKYSQVSWGFAWSPDGKSICFQGVRKDLESEIAVVSAAGQEKGLRVLWSPKDREGEEHAGNYFSWSPDGKEILLSMMQAGDPNYQLYALDAAGKKPPRRLKGQNPSCSNFGGIWSPDGKKIAFASLPGVPAEEQEPEAE
ncbi:MAG: PD40 domain-containing protein [Pirellulales bacterium]|nr:PD40 domain-containing protein [Pirellulales bacterium]